MTLCLPLPSRSLSLRVWLLRNSRLSLYAFIRRGKASRIQQHSPDIGLHIRTVRSRVTETSIPSSEKVKYITWS
jgi:hypothetical protein